MKTKKINLKYIIIFFLFTLLQERFFYQTDVSLVLVISILGLVYFLLNITEIINTKYEFKIMIFFLFIIEVYGIVISYFKYGQSLLTGFIGTHYIFIYGFYFYFSRLLAKGNMERNLENFKKIFIAIGLMYALLLIVQKIIYPISVLKLNYAIRNGLRIQGCSIIEYAFAIAICDIINDFKPKKLIAVLIMGYELLAINQARNVILVFGIIMLISFYKKVYDKKKIYAYILLLCLPIIIFLSSKLGYFDIVNDIVGETQNVKGTSGVRVNELNYYGEKLKESHYLGIGVIANSVLKDTVLGNEVGFYLEDIGISAFIIKTGIIGFLWTILWIFKLFRRINKQEAWIKILGLFVALKTVCSMFFSVSFLFDFRDGLIYFVMILAILDSKKKFIEQKGEKNEYSSAWSNRNK